MELARNNLTTMKRTISIPLREWVRMALIKEKVKDQMDRMEKDQEEVEISLVIEEAIKEIREIKEKRMGTQELSLNLTKNHQKTPFIMKNQRMVLDLTKANERISQRKRTKVKSLELQEPMQMVDTVNKMKLQDTALKMEILMITHISSHIPVKRLSLNLRMHLQKTNVKRHESY